MSATDATPRVAAADGPPHAAASGDHSSDYWVPARDARSEQMVVNMGPQHPATHGVLRVVIRTDGEVVLDCEPLIGNLHRCKEKIAENVQYVQFMPYTDRLDYLAAMNNEEVFARAVEKLCGIEIPERIEYIRTIVAELGRISSHIFAIGVYGLDLGAFTPFLYCYRERERANSLFEKLTGGRMLYHYYRVGGVARDVSDEWLQECLEFIAIVEEKSQEYNALTTWNKVFMERTMGIGVLSREKAIAYGVTGPALRASAVDFDVRRDDPYGIYDRFDWKVPVCDGRYGTVGDCWNRHWIRAQELHESISIIRQAIDELPPRDPALTPKSVYQPYVNPNVPRMIRGPKHAEVYVRGENPRGELAFYLVSDGKNAPYRCKIRGPGFSNLAILPETCRGYLIADLVAIIGSIDIVLGEVDR